MDTEEDAVLQEPPEGAELVLERVPDPQRCRQDQERGDPDRAGRPHGDLLGLVRIPVVDVHDGDEDQRDSENHADRDAEPLEHLEGGRRPQVERDADEREDARGQTDSPRRDVPADATLEEPAQWGPDQQHPDVAAEVLLVRRRSATENKPVAVPPGVPRVVAHDEAVSQ